SIVKKLRHGRIGTPILLLTARDSPEDVITGLDAGADDYLTKPFSFKVLMARLRAIARRRHLDPHTVLRIGDLSLDPVGHEVKRAGVPIPISKTEFVILELLIRNAGRVITRVRLIEAVWGHERGIPNNTVDVFIRQLRAKIEAPGTLKLLHTIRGIGYTLREEDGA